MSWALALLLFARIAGTTPPEKDAVPNSVIANRVEAETTADAPKTSHDLWVAQQVPEQLTDQEACAMLEDKVERLAPQLPLQVTYEKFRLRSSVDCTAKVYRVDDEASVLPSAMPQGWQIVEQDQWNEEFCDSLLTLPLTWRGWRFVDEVSFPGGQKVQFDVKCR